MVTNADRLPLTRHKALNGWRLFWLIAGPLSAVMVVAMLRADLTTGPGVSSLIQLSVRMAVPVLFVAFAASSIQTLFPGSFGQWLLRNRKYVGLAYAAGMAWQGFFILWMVTIHRDYYVNEVYFLRDAIEGVGGYLFLAAMTFTSFRPGRQLLSAKQWKFLHKAGMYYLWAYAFSVYWWALFYYGNPVVLDYIYYWLGFAAWAVRPAAWSKRRLKAVSGDPAGSSIALLGYAVIAVGFVAAVFGSAWYPTVNRLLTGYALTALPETYLPYWPFEPFLPMFFILAGVMLFTRSRLSGLATA
jgi:hypothetical protein